MAAASPAGVVVAQAWAAVDCSDHIECALLSRDERLVCLGSAGGEILVVDAEAGTVVKALQAHAGGTLAMCLTPDGRLVSGGEDSCVRLHSLETLEPTGQLRVEAVAGVNCPTGTWVSAVACAHDRARVAAGAGQTIVVADVDSGAFGAGGAAGVPGGFVQSLGPLERAVDCLAFMSDGTLCSCGYGGVTLWRAAGAGAPAGGGAADGPLERVPRLAKTYHVGTEGTTLGYKGWLLSLAPAPSGEWIASGCSDNTVRLWRVASGQDFKCGGYSTKISCVLWDPSGSLCATSGSNQATLWDFSQGSPAGTAPIACVGQRALVTALAFHPAGRLFASGSVDGSVKLYDVCSYEQGNLREGRPHVCHPLASFSTASTVGDGACAVERLVWARSGVLVVACAHGRSFALRVSS